MTNLLLRAGVPYSRRDGTRVVLEDRGDLLIDRVRGGLYAHNSPRLFKNEEDRSDIVGLYLEPGTWRTRSGHTVEVMPRGTSCTSFNDYPFMYEREGFELTINRLGAYLKGREEPLDIVDYVSALKCKAEFARDGYIADGHVLKQISPEWRAFLVRWLDTNDALRLFDYYDRVVSLIGTHPSVIPYDAEQMYLHTRYVDQNGWTFSMDEYDVKAQILRSRSDSQAPSEFVLQYTERGDVAVATLVPKYFIHGGEYHARVAPRYHTPPHLEHNQPHQTYNRLTNMYAEMEREVDKKLFNDEYNPVPEGFKTKWGTGVHMSTQTPGLLAYFPTLRHWQRRVPQQIKPGRYLRQYFPDMHDDDVRRMSGLCAAGDLRYYTDWQDMLEVYKQLADDGVVSSCMSYDKWGDMHPLMVYDNSDVELAVLYIGDQPVARALYNKHNKHFPMVYGQWEKMEHALYNAGFIHDSLCGARIRKLPRYVNCYRRDIDLDNIWEHADDNTILMPYIDHKRDLDRSSYCSTNVDIDGDHIVIRYDDGKYSANNHENAILGRQQTQCEHCDDHVDADNTYFVSGDEIDVCHYCYTRLTVLVYSSPNNYVRYMETTAESHHIWLDSIDKWVTDSDAAAEFGFRWSCWADEYLDEDYAVWVEDGNDWYPDNQIGRTIMWDEEDEVYLTTKEYDRRMAEREQDEAA